MSRILDDVPQMSEWMANALRSSGYSADYTFASLAEIDRFIDDNSSPGAAHPNGLLAEGLGMKLFALGAYVGETIRRRAGGTWQANDDDPEGEINAALVMPNGSMIWPVQRILKRYTEGREAGISAYGAALGLD
ncbi:hypothetical protein [Streptomyces tirandamycinicus]|uniref:hypothetical protein n=1 Tax=Streptomyces tirandamycinicus TaxID=2174846 RepID=UPI0011B21092|nr:hypothetical protein [Streptomyces tirandamycinicus]